MWTDFVRAIALAADEEATNRLAPSPNLREMGSWAFHYS